MQVVCEATQSPSSDVQVAAFACLVRIMHLYYDYMKFYMERALFGVRDLSPIGRVRFGGTRLTPARRCAFLRSSPCWA